MSDHQPDRHDERPRSADAVRRGALALAAILVLALPAALHHTLPQLEQRPAAVEQPKAPVAKLRQERRFAHFNGESASLDVRRMAHWVADSRDNGTRSFVIIDKREARVYLFDRNARLQAAVPALLGSARGDDTFPGVGDKPIAEVRDEEKTTPAGRFIAEVGESSSRGEDVVWVDYDAAVSMHRIIQKPERLQAMATPTPEDNRMSFGCVNLPVDFYEQALRPAVDRDGVVIYVLPETRPLEQTFASFYDVRVPTRVAQH